ncbi:hypothetical protein CR513_51518, partial [Mucuna pruriens]
MRCSKLGDRRLSHQVMISHLDIRPLFATIKRRMEGEKGKQPRKRSDEQSPLSAEVVRQHEEVEERQRATKERHVEVLKMAMKACPNSTSGVLYSPAGVPTVHKQAVGIQPRGVVRIPLDTQAYHRELQNPTYSDRKVDPTRSFRPICPNKTREADTYENQPPIEITSQRLLSWHITTISKDDTFGGKTALATKRYARVVMAVQGSNLRPRDPVICFTGEDYEGTSPHQDDPMVISLITVDYKIERVLIDHGSSVNVLYWSMFQKLRLPTSNLEECSGTLFGIVEE